MKLSPGVVGEKRQSVGSNGSLDRVLEEKAEAEKEEGGDHQKEDSSAAIAAPHDHHTWDDSTEMSLLTSVTR